MNRRSKDPRRGVRNRKRPWLSQGCHKGCAPAARERQLLRPCRLSPLQGVASGQL